MGLFEFLIVVVLVVFACWLAVYAVGYLAPGHPAIIDKLIWGVGIVIILVLFLQATGILAHDVQIPRLR
jgi:hypothetical protein